MDTTELIQLIGRVRRDTRSTDVVTLCDEAMRLLTAVNVNTVNTVTPVNAVNTARSDMAAYMRAYRAKRANSR